MKRRPSSQSVGKRAEESAVRLLAEKGCRILARNYRCKRGEIDIVAQDGATLVFVEVRCRAGQRGYSMNSALESIDPHKRRRLAMAARHYLATHPTDAPCRFDVICVAGDPDEAASVLHLPAAFTLDDI